MECKELICYSSWPRSPHYSGTNKDQKADGSIWPTIFLWWWNCHLANGTQAKTPFCLCLQQTGCSSKSLSASITVFGRFCDFESLVVNFQIHKSHYVVTGSEQWSHPWKHLSHPMNWYCWCQAKRTFLHIWYGDFGAIICNRECWA